jgi:dipeptidyl-peptidase-4
MRPYLILFATLALFLGSTAALAQEKLLTIDDIYDPAKRVNFSGSPPQGLKWLKDGLYYLQAKPDQKSGLSQVMKVKATSGEASPFFDASKMEAALSRLPGIKAQEAKDLAHADSYHLNPDETAILLNHGHELIYYPLGGDNAKILTSGSEDLSNEEFSPNGRMASFVRGHNVFVVDIEAGRESRLTSDGGPSTLNGRLDWVYEEELYGRGETGGYWWSPDSTHITFLRLDETPVHKFVVVDHIPRLQAIEDTFYPLAGDPNPLVKLGVVDVKGGATTWVDTSAYVPADLLIVRVSWSPDGRRVVYQAQNREQTFLDLNYADPQTGRSTRLFQEKTRAWVEVVDNPQWLKDDSFLWRSERSGWMHLYHYSPEGKLVGQVTDGKWEVRSFQGVDESRGYAYFTATEHNPIAEQAYRIKLDGTGLTRLSQSEGSHRISVDPSRSHFIDYWSDVNTPIQVRLFKTDGTLERVIDENKVEALTRYKLSKPEFLQVKTRDGFVMEAMMIKPPSFDPAKKYPVWSGTYSGPHAPQVRNGWGGSTSMWYQLLAQKGYIIWVCDNRSASGKGVESEWPVYRNFGELELRDLEDGVAYLKSQPFVDGSRIGLWGWSYGGFMTTYALTHSQSFKVGIAGGSVTSWLDYDSIYTERYMQTPQHNPEGYKRSAPQAAAKDLHGKLLLIHGTIDDNVHLQNTVQFVYDLQKAGKQFQIMVYPKSRHGVSDLALVRHMREMMTDFILANL